MLNEARIITELQKIVELEREACEAGDLNRGAYEIVELKVKGRVVKAIVKLGLHAVEYSDFDFGRLRKPKVSRPAGWYLLKFLVSKENRERVFLPAYYDLMADYLSAKTDLGSAGWWLCFRFKLRGVRLVLCCIAVATRANIVRNFGKMVPPELKERFRLWWIGMFH